MSLTTSRARSTSMSPRQSLTRFGLSEDELQQIMHQLPLEYSCTSAIQAERQAMLRL